MLVHSGFSQTNKSILGVWVTPDKDANIEIYESNGTFYGKTIWHDLQKHQGVTTDIMNPDENLKKNPIIGLVVLKGLTFKNNRWENGRCYDPETGKTYSGYLEIINDRMLKLRGYIGIPLFGRSEIWTRKK